MIAALTALAALPACADFVAQSSPAPNHATAATPYAAPAMFGELRYEAPATWAAPAALAFPSATSRPPVTGPVLASDAGTPTLPPGPDSLSLALASLSALVALRAGRAAGGLKVHLPSLSLRTHAVHDLELDEFGRIHCDLLPIWSALVMHSPAPSAAAVIEHPDPLPDSPVLLRLRPRGPPCC